MNEAALFNKRDDRYQQLDRMLSNRHSGKAMASPLRASRVVALIYGYHRWIDKIVFSRVRVNAPQDHHDGE